MERKTFTKFKILAVINMLLIIFFCISNTMKYFQLETIQKLYCIFFVAGIIVSCVGVFFIFKLSADNTSLFNKTAVIIMAANCMVAVYYIACVFIKIRSNIFDFQDIICLFSSSAVTFFWAYMVFKLSDYAFKPIVCFAPVWLSIGLDTVYCVFEIKKRSDMAMPTPISFWISVLLILLLALYRFDYAFSIYGAKKIVDSKQQSNAECELNQK